MRNHVKPVSPICFAEEMAHHWRERGNTASHLLKETWQKLAWTFGRALLGVNGLKPVQVVQLPTGTGKTQGTALYCAMLHRANQGRPPGILFVAREINQCAAMVSSINDHAGEQVAFAHHSSKPLSYDGLQQAPILVITHEALLKAMRKEVKGKRSRWSDYCNWEGGRRDLIIIDEALTGLVEEYRLKDRKLKMVLGAIPTEVEGKHPSEVKALRHLLALLEEKRGATDRGEKVRMEVLWDGDGGVPDVDDNLDFDNLRETLNHVEFDKEVFEKEGCGAGKTMQTLIDEVLRSAEALLDGYCLIAKRGADHLLASSLNILPSDAPPMVILDATAEQSELWLFLRDRVEIIKASQGVRRYDNVKLHVARCRGLGKRGMTTRAEVRFSRVCDALNKEVGRGRKLLMVTHKDVKHVAAKYDLHADAELVHWRSIDGKNDWKDYDAVALIGLSYRDNIWPITTFFAACGPQSHQWLSSPHWNGSEDILRELQQRQLTVSCVQAINRVGCRKVIDEDGNCPPTDAFICLPVGADGDAVLARIKDEMPGIKVVPWVFQLDGPKAAVRRRSYHDQLLYYLDREEGRLPFPQIAEALQMSAQARKELRKVMRDPCHPLTASLRELGWRYEEVGRTRAARQYLVKGTG